MSLPFLATRPQFLLNMYNLPAQAKITLTTSSGVIFQWCNILCVNEDVTNPSVYAAFLESSPLKYMTELSGLVYDEISP